MLLIPALLFGAALTTLLVLWFMEHGAPEKQAMSGAAIIIGAPRPGSLWVEDNYANLPENEWVAADDQGLVAHDPDLISLAARLRTMGVTEDWVTIAFIQHDIVD